MPDMKKYKQYIEFMQEYVAFLEQMAGVESERLFALTSWDLQRVEKSIAASQANAKKLENMEMKRVAIQAEAGFGGKTFKEILEAVPEAEKDLLAGVLLRFEQAIQEIKYNNDKSMAVARDNMMRVDPEAVLQGAQKQNPYGRATQATYGNSLFNTNV